VSTLDGKLSALDDKDEGKLLWSVAADSRPLLSSSISKMEVTNIFKENLEVEIIFCPMRCSIWYI
jgi:hypothetical protein